MKCQVTDFVDNRLCMHIFDIVSILGKQHADCKLIFKTILQLHAELCQHFDVSLHQFSDLKLICVVCMQYRQNW